MNFDEANTANTYAHRRHTSRIPSNGRVDVGETRMSKFFTLPDAVIVMAIESHHYTILEKCGIWLEDLHECGSMDSYAFAGLRGL